MTEPALLDALEQRGFVQTTPIQSAVLPYALAGRDVIGLGEWRLAEHGGEVDLRYLWRVRVGKPWMQRFEFLLKPVFTWNHNWVMRRGEQGLRAELARRKAVPAA